MAETLPSDVPPLPAPPPLASLPAAALFLDFDGTLVEIADGPDLIRVPDGLAERLERLAGRLSGRLALVSGRSIGDIERHAGALPVAVGGSHGAEMRLADGRRLGGDAQTLPDEVMTRLRDFAGVHSGVLLEEKPLGAALHYRGARAHGAAVDTLARRIAADHGLKLTKGKMVAELMPAGHDKGTAVKAFMAEAGFAGAMPVFVGDDVTDEDGFAAARELGGYGILVGNPRPTAASYRLASPAAVHDWLGL